jgi:poly-gamma-glutamate synthesis protein (capsule biosynthesis protein)
LLVGDLILDEPDPHGFFAPAAGLLRAGDVVIGHVEVPHSTRGSVVTTDVPARPSNPEHLRALQNAGFSAVTLAGNHIADAGPEAIEDTLATLRGLGIATAGAGMNLAEARRPAIVEAQGLRVGILSYNCVGPRESWARPSKAGCAYLNVLTHYELDHRLRADRPPSTPSRPPRASTPCETILQNSAHRSTLSWWGSTRG